MSRAGLWPRVVALALVLTGCGTLPELPPRPEPAEIGSDPAPTENSEATEWAPGGFSPAERVAVRVRNVGCGGVSTGSGFALSPSQLVTNRHVVAGATTLQVSTFDGEDLLVDAAGAGLVADIAIVDTRSALPAAVTLAEDNPEIGDAVEIVGYPGGGRLTTTSGNVVSYEADPLNSNAGQVIVTDAPAERGSSGSPLYSEDGDVVGVVYAATSDGRHSLAVPVETLHELLNDEGFTDELPPCAQE
jgi:S1-C subfamily serine protease